MKDKIHGELIAVLCADYCNFCTRHQGLFRLSGSHPMRPISVVLCKYCAEQLHQIFSGIEWKVEV